MKKQFFSAAFISLVSFGAMSQVKDSKKSGGFMIKGGVNLANISTTSNGRVDKANTLTSFQAGIGFDIPVADGLFLQPGLLLTGKGAKTETGQTTGTSSSATYLTATSNPLYVELPVNIVGKIPLSEYTRIFIGAGPYVAMGVGGKNKVDGAVVGIKTTSERSIEYSNDNPFTRPEENAGYGRLKRFDYGLNALAGLDFNKFAIGVNYGYGFTKINSNTNNNANDKGKNRVFSILLGIKI